MLHRKCGSRLKQQLFCPKDSEVVPRDETVKGYEFAKDRYVTFTAEELEALEEKATQTVEITEFVPLDKVDPIFFDKAYYLGPDKGGDKAYSLLARAMEEQLTEVEAARLKRTPAANPEAEDLALQCEAAVQKGAYFGKEADAGYPLCEQALGVDPNNVRALTWLAVKVENQAVDVGSIDRAGRSQAGGRVSVESARPRFKLCQGSLHKGWYTLS